jgi:O-antigen ligase
VGVVATADGLSHERPNVSPVPQLSSWATVWQPSASRWDRVIDAAIVAFLVCSVFSITAAQASILLALSAWIGKLVWTPEERSLDLPLLLPVTAFYLASIIASATAVDPLRSFKDLRNIFEPALFFLLVNQVVGEERATALLRILIVAGTLMAGYGLGQSLVQGADFRVHGTMSIYMTFAGILMLIALMTLAQVLFTPRRPLTYGLVLASILLIASLVMTHTRGAWMGLLGGSIVMLGCWRKRFLLLLPLAAVVVFVASPEAVQKRIRSIVDPQDVTALERLYMWNSGLQILRDHPWTGVGIGGVKRVYTAYKHPQALRDQRTHLHSNFLQVAAERGLLGLGCWLWIWGAFYSYAWRIYRGLRLDDWGARALVVGSLASVTAFHVAGVTEYTFGDSEVIMIVYFLMALPFMVRQTFQPAMFT